MLEIITPFLTPAVAVIAAFIAIRTLNLRARVDHADQWWKRAQYGIDKALDPDAHVQVVGVGIINSLLDPVLKEQPSDQERADHVERVKKLKKVSWKVSQAEKDMLAFLVAGDRPLGKPEPLSVADLQEAEDLQTDVDQSKIDTTEAKEGEKHVG